MAYRARSVFRPRSLGSYYELKMDNNFPGPDVSRIFCTQKTC